MDYNKEFKNFVQRVIEQANTIQDKALIKYETHGDAPEHNSVDNDLLEHLDQ